MKWLFLEDIPFDEDFGLSLFRMKSDSELLDIVVDPEFIKELEIEKAKLISNRNLQSSPQSSITTNQIPKLCDSTSTSFSSLSFPHISENYMTPPFIPSIPQ